MSSYWNFAAASVRGTSHVQSDTPCQDASVIQVSSNGEWLALVASDGAGTAAHSDFSSKLVSEKFAEALIELSAELARQDPGAWVTDVVIEEIVGLRKQLRKVAGGDDISAYHCTLVAALIGPSGGFVIHLGDGAVFAGMAGANVEVSIDLSSDYLVSLPQNGEYANETVFMTERDWIKNLRIQPVSAIDWLVLGTDGGMALAMLADRVPKTGFVTPILQVLLSCPDRMSRDASLHAILSDRQADRLTNDDKTLIAIVRSGSGAVVGEFQENKPPPPRSTATSSATSSRSAPEQQHSSNSPVTRQTGAVKGQQPTTEKWKWLLRYVPIAARSRSILAAAVVVYLGVNLLHEYLNPSPIPHAIKKSAQKLEPSANSPVPVSPRTPTAPEAEK